MRKLVVLSPYGPPGANGLCDHVDQIVAALGDLNLPSIDRIGVTTSVGYVDMSRAIVMRGDARSLDSLLDRFVTRDSTLVVQYVGYGYQRRGCPFSLVRSLRRLRSLRSFRMISVFHELHASGPPWTSTFYVGPLQRFPIAALANLSDQAVTSTLSYRRTLEGYVRCVGKHPVNSNVGEPSDPSELGQRPNTAVVFGLPASRRRLFESGLLERTLRDLSVDEVFEIGTPCRRPQKIGAVRWHQCGELDKNEVSKVLLSSRFGLLEYPRDLLAKSGVFAAYSSHRMVPVLLAQGGAPAEELKPRVHYLDSAEIASINTEPLQHIADESWRQYKTACSLAVCRELYGEWCRD